VRTYHPSVINFLGQPGVGELGPVADLGARQQGVKIDGRRADLNWLAGFDVNV
jgi:hypothetical protein